MPDYNLTIPQPAQTSFAQAVQGFAGLKQLADQSALAPLQRKEAELTLEAQQMKTEELRRTSGLRKEFYALTDRLGSGDVVTEKELKRFQTISGVLNPQAQDDIARLVAQKSERERNAAAGVLGMAMAAVRNGKPDLALESLREAADAADKSNDPILRAMKPSLLGWAEIIPKMEPKAALAAGANVLGSFNEGRTVLKGIFDTESDLRKQTAATGGGGGKLMASDVKALADFNKAASDLNNASSEAASLLNTIEDLEAKGKITSKGYERTAKEGIKAFFGEEDDLSAMQKQWQMLIAPQVMKSLPPGAASDADLAFAKKPFLEANANPKLLKDFLVRMRDAQSLGAEINNVKAAWLQENGGQGPMRQETEIAGRLIKKGMTFLDLQKQMTKEFKSGGRKDEMKEARVLGEPSLAPRQDSLPQSDATSESESERAIRILIQRGVIKG